MALTKNSKILASDVSGAIKSITRSGTTFTYTTLGGSWKCAEYWNPSSDGGSSFWSIATRSGGTYVSMFRHSLLCIIAIRTS